MLPKKKIEEMFANIAPRPDIVIDRLTIRLEAEKKKKFHAACKRISKELGRHIDMNSVMNSVLDEWLEVFG